MSSPIYYFQDYSNKYFDRCDNGNYNTQVACETSGEWWFEGVDSKCVYCAAGTWTGGYCQESTGTGPAIYMTGTSCLYLYDVIFFTLNHTYTRINIPFFFIHSFIFFRWSWDHSGQMQCGSIDMDRRNWYICWSWFLFCVSRRYLYICSKRWNQLSSA